MGDSYRKRIVFIQIKDCNNTLEDVYSLRRKDNRITIRLTNKILRYNEITRAIQTRNIVEPQENYFYVFTKARKSDQVAQCVSKSKW